MKLKIIWQNDSVYSDFGLSLDISKEKWIEWDMEVMRRYKEGKITWNFEWVYDTDECWECWVLSRQHAIDIIKYFNLWNSDKKQNKVK